MGGDDLLFSFKWHMNSAARFNFHLSSFNILGDTRKWSMALLKFSRLFTAQFEVTGFSCAQKTQDLDWPFIDRFSWIGAPLYLYHHGERFHVTRRHSKTLSTAATHQPAVFHWRNECLPSRYYEIKLLKRRSLILISLRLHYNSHTQVIVPRTKHGIKKFRLGLFFAITLIFSLSYEG